GIEQVNQTIVQMDETTQQNAALVEEATAAARSMEEQAHALAESVAVFKLEARAKTGGLVRSKASALRPAKAPAAPAASVRKPAVRKPEPAFTEGDWQEF
ncbi:MAG: methyl-accepting chemotaxis protein, partial [Pseudoxanthomonas sp.]|nr:methyl-accepting chemotaxis protein [Pseudoxanthomonas sp.]